jgi:hypothetical protein
MSDSNSAEPVRPASIRAEGAELFQEWIKNWDIYVSDIFPDYETESPDQSFEAAFQGAFNFTRNLHEAVAAWSKGEEYPPVPEAEAEPF